MPSLFTSLCRIYAAIWEYSENVEVGVLWGVQRKKSGRLFKRSRLYGEILRSKGYEGYLAHIKRQPFQEQKLSKKANTKMAWSETKEFPRRQSSQKPRTVSIQQGRKQRLKNNFLFLTENFWSQDLKNTYICTTGDICITCLSSLLGKEYRSGRIENAAHYFVTEKCKIQELHFEKTLIEKN